MKKTEKIELRVDHAEKDRLMNIAERRGQTISDVVRDALAGELGSAPQSYPRWPGVLSFLACGFSVIALGFGLSVWSAGIKSNADPDQSHYALYAASPFSALHSTAVVHRDGFSQTYEFRWKGDVYRSVHDVEEIGANVHRLNVSICRVVQTGCDEIDTGVMVLSTPAAFVKGKALNFHEKGESLFSSNVTATRIEGKTSESSQS